VRALRSELPEARSQLEQALAMSRKTQEIQHPDVIPHLIALYWVLRQQGDTASAEARRQEALVIAAKHRAYGAWPLWKSFRDLADALKAQERHADAEALLTELANLKQEFPLRDGPPP
jgi:hypothetical protein